MQITFQDHLYNIIILLFIGILLIYLFNKPPMILYRQKYSLDNLSCANLIESDNVIKSPTTIKQWK